jgi:hypothetical protein
VKIKVEMKMEDDLEEEVEDLQGLCFVDEEVGSQNKWECCLT